MFAGVLAELYSRRFNAVPTNKPLRHKPPASEGRLCPISKEPRGIYVTAYSGIGLIGREVGIAHGLVTFGIYILADVSHLGVFVIYAMYLG